MGGTPMKVDINPLHRDLSQSQLQFYGGSTPTKDKSRKAPYHKSKTEIVKPIGTFSKEVHNISTMDSIKEEDLGLGSLSPYLKDADSLLHRELHDISEFKDQLQDIKEEKEPEQQGI